MDEEYEFDENDCDEFLARATYFSKFQPVFYGLTEEQIILNNKQVEGHKDKHYRSMEECEALYHKMMLLILLKSLN